MVLWSSYRMDCRWIGDAMARLVSLIWKGDSSQFFSLVEGGDHLSGNKQLNRTFNNLERDGWVPEINKWFIDDLAPDKLTG